MKSISGLVSIENNYTCLFAFTATSSLQEFDRNFIEID